MFSWFLNLVYLLLLAVVSPWLVFRSLARGKHRTGWSQRLWGAVPRSKSQRPRLWLHAVSVGEVLQLGPIVEGLARQQPDLEFVISVTTSTGYDVARQKYPACRVVYYPLDFSWAVNRALDRIRPTVIALVELELWPNFLLAAAVRGIPVLLVNGRMSERSFRGYLRIGPLVREMLGRVRRFLVQNETYAMRLVELGADRGRITVTGSIKFDGAQTDRKNPRTSELRRLFGLAANERVFIAGSTQAPEEEAAINAWLTVRQRHPDLRLILVPRHQERFEDVARLVEERYHLPLARRSRMGAANGPDVTLPAPDRPAPLTGQPLEPARGTVLLLDTLGELAACWGLADVAFVGGSFTQRGGQNMIEPAGYGAVVLLGPNTWNFKDVVESLLGQEAAFVVRDPSELTLRLEQVLSDPALARQVGRRAAELVARQRGATARTLEFLAATVTDAWKSQNEQSPAGASGPIDCAA